MKRGKVFAGAILSLTSIFVGLPLLAFYAFFGFGLLQEPAVLVYAICMLGALAFGLLAFILNTVLGVKTRASNSKYGKKGLAVTTIIFDLFTLATLTVTGVLMLDFVKLIGGAGAEAIMTIVPMVFPAFFIVATLFVSTIIKIVGLCGKKKVAVIEDADKTEEQASV